MVNCSDGYFYSTTTCMGNLETSKTGIKKGKKEGMKDKERKEEKKESKDSRS